MQIDIIVKNKIASVVDPAAYIVCGNSDYIINFTFDEDWAAYEVKTARFVFGGSFVDVVFYGNNCPVPVISNSIAVSVGVFAGNLSTTTPAYINCKKSIICNDGLPAEPFPDAYAQIQKELDETKKLVQTLLDSIYNGEIAENLPYATGTTKGVVKVGGNGLEMVDGKIQLEQMPPYVINTLDLSVDEIQQVINYCIVQSCPLVYSPGEQIRFICSQVYFADAKRDTVVIIHSNFAASGLITVNRNSYKVADGTRTTKLYTIQSTLK